MVVFVDVLVFWKVQEHLKTGQKHPGEAVKVKVIYITLLPRIKRIVGSVKQRPLQETGHTKPSLLSVRPSVQRTFGALINSDQKSV